MNKSLTSLVGVSALLIETSSRDLSQLNGAFGLTAAEWTIVVYAAGIAIAVAAVLIFHEAPNA